MDERLRFVARLLEGDKMATLCREFGISRKTGYKLYRRYRDIGLEGLTDRSRRPYRQANKLPFQVESRIVQLRKEHPSWGAPKIREKLQRTSACRPPPSAPCTPCSTATASSPAAAPTLQGRGHRAVGAPSAQRSVVCRLQG